MSQFISNIINKYEILQKKPLIQIDARCEIALCMVDTSKTILQKYFQIGRPICKSTGQSVIDRLAGQFVNWPDWQMGPNIYILSYYTLSLSLNVS